MMPGKDGIVTLKEIKADDNGLNRETPVICLTANASSGAREQYVAAGFDDYLTKPIDPIDLEDTLIRYLPADKVEYLNDEAENGRNDEKKTDISVSLKPIVESELIDVSAGIRNSGSVDSYLSMLKVFRDSVFSNENEMVRFISEKNMHGYAVLMCSLGKTAAMIGATGLYEYTVKLENAAKAEDHAYIKKENEVFIAEYLKLHKQLSALDLDSIVV